MFRRLAACAFVVLMAGSAIAADIGFQVEQGVMTYTSMNIEQKPDGGDTTKIKSDKMEMMPDSLEVGLFIDKLHVYVYPTQTAEPVGIAYQVMKELEVGLNLGMNSSKVDKPTKDESATNEYGLWATYALKAGPGDLELTPAISMKSGTVKKEEVDTTTNLSATTKTTTNETVYGLEVAYVLPLGKNLSWMGGLAYVMGSEEEKVEDAKVKTTMSGFGVNATTFRVTF